MPNRVHIRRALLSVSDKSGLIDFARGLHAMGVHLVSTGGTAKALADAGLPVTPIDELTGFPEMMDGRVKTLHPKVHGGILAVRDNREHVASMLEHAIQPIDLVCINLYPFEATIAKPGVSREDAIENIDIGGPSMVRSASKNHEFVTIVSRPSQYAGVLQEMQANDACTTLATRRSLAQAAFDMTAKYDTAIAAYLARDAGITHPAAASTASSASSVPCAPSSSPSTPGTAEFPNTLSLNYELAQPLRYGENPHQAAAVYRDAASPSTHAGPTVIPGPATRQLHGKELSYNNIADAAAALELAIALAAFDNFARVGACVIKHANPCGAALATSAFSAIDRAIAGDPVAAFGGILACSHEIDDAAANRLTGKATFLEVVIAPSFSSGALELLKARSVNVRLLAVGNVHPAISPSATGVNAPCRMARTVPGGLLIQDRDRLAPAPATWQHMAGPAPVAAQLKHAAVIEIMVRAIASNAIAIGGPDMSHIAPSTGAGGVGETNSTARHNAVRLFGAGVGQVDRVTACRLAVEKAGELCKGAIALSDAFFPFPDGPKMLIDAGITTIVHPGGSKRDQETFDLCNTHAVTCLVTGTRRFRH